MARSPRPPSSGSLPAVPAQPPSGAGVQAAARAAAQRSREVAALRDQLRRMLDQPEASEAFARALRGWMRREP